MRAMAYDSQTAGYNTFNTVSVRLWTALPIFGNEAKKIGSKADLLSTSLQFESKPAGNANVD